MATYTIRDTLKVAQQTKEVVELLLGNNRVIAGYVDGVGEHCVLLKELTDREGFFAIVRIDQVSAILARV